MKIIIEPRVQIFSKQTFLEVDDFEIPNDGEDSVKIGSFCAKVCYDSNGKDGRSNIDNQGAILEHRHGSVLEHIHIGLWIEGITRGLSLELNRHRSFNISQRSTRYTEEDDASFVLDPYYASLYRKYNFKSAPGFTWMCDGSDKVEDFNPDEVNLVNEHLSSLRDSQRSYINQVGRLMSLNPNELEGFALRKWARGKARNLLPHALETRGSWTNNVRGWRWFIESRSNRHAEPEIRRLANTVLHELWKHAPLYFEDFSNNGTYDGITEYVPTFSKV